MEPQSLYLYKLIEDTISSSNKINISKEDKEIQGEEKCLVVISQEKESS